MNVHYFLPFLQVHGGSGSTGLAESVETFLILMENLSEQPLINSLELMMPGIFEMPNIHPILVHFPIAFLIGFFIIDLIGALFKQPAWRTAASGLLYLGTISIVLTVITGFMAAGSVAHDDVVHSIITQHQKLGLISTALALILSVWRLFSKGIIHGKIMNGFYLFLSALLSTLIILGADLGGLMVYKHGVAIEPIAIIEEAPSDFHEHSSHDHNHEH
jgi:uncharacterized membrane protein